MKDEPIRRTAEQARGGEIILRTRAQRLIFFGGLVAFLVFTLVMAF